MLDPCRPLPGLAGGVLIIRWGWTKDPVYKDAGPLPGLAGGVLIIRWGWTKDPVYKDAGPLLSSAWTGWMCFDSEVEVEAAKCEPYRRFMLRAVQLSYEVYSSCGGEGLRCNVYSVDCIHFQYPDRVKPLEILTSLWSGHCKRCPVPLAELSSCYLRCTPAVEEEDFDVL